MGIQDIKSNVKAIQQSHLIPISRKKNLLHIQLQTIQLLFLETNDMITPEEKQEAQLLCEDIQNYLDSFFLEVTV